MKYSVIEAFVDLQDGKHLYRVGDNYPRAGHDVNLSRLNELASANNALGHALIKLVAETKAEVKVEKTVEAEKPVENEEPADFEDKTEEKLTKDSINSMQFFTLKAQCKKHGIEVEGKKAHHLREELMKFAEA